MTWLVRVGYVISTSDEDRRMKAAGATRWNGRHLASREGAGRQLYLTSSLHAKVTKKGPSSCWLLAGPSTLTLGASRSHTRRSGSEASPGAPLPALCALPGSTCR